MELSKYITFECVEMRRSDIRLAEYNPRYIEDEARAALKQGIEKFGVVGGIIVNRRTGNTLVGGHQKILILDELNGYPKKDYVIRVDVVDLDLSGEKALNVLLNNPKAQGRFDEKALAELLVQIEDYTDTGFSEKDLEDLGVGMLPDIMTEEVSGSFGKQSEPFGTSENKSEQARTREMIAENQSNGEVEQVKQISEHLKEEKKRIAEEAKKNDAGGEEFLMLSFDNFDNKAAFLERFGHDKFTKVIKGEELDARVEIIYADEDY